MVNINGKRLDTGNLTAFPIIGLEGGSNPTACTPDANC
jgi:hypothetical protein